MKKYLALIAIFLVMGLGVGLRFYRLDNLTTPYWEEVALGYDAYAISETGRDHHGHYLPLVAFESFGDWKPAGYFYAIVPAIKLWGLSVWAVRLPSALAGIAIMVGVWQLLVLILPLQWRTNHPFIPVLGLLVTAISPWAIMFSRAAWEVNLATALVTWGIISFFKFLQLPNSNRRWWYFGGSGLLLILSMYTYHATRLIAPVLGLSLVWLWFVGENHSTTLRTGLKNFFTQNFMPLALSAVLAFTLVSPILLASSQVTGQRFAETSIFSDLSLIEASNRGQQFQPNILGKVFYHRYVLFATAILKNYLSHFDFDFLFLSGDQNPRHASQYFGQLYHIELIYLFLGLVFVIAALRKRSDNDFDAAHRHYLIFLLAWLFVGIIPAALTKATPHALRILPTLPVFMILITLGVAQLEKDLKKVRLPQITQPLFWLAVGLIYWLELAVFWRFYTQIYPTQSAHEWQYGYEQLVRALEPLAQTGQPIYITREQGRPAMYWWFYNQTDPQLVQAGDSTNKQDQGEYLEFQNLHFSNSLQEVTTVPAIVAGSPAQIAHYQATTKTNLTIIQEIFNPEGEIIWQIYHSRKN